MRTTGESRRLFGRPPGQYRRERLAAPRRPTPRPAPGPAQRACGTGHRAALRHLANRLTGILHGCLKTRTLYDETTAWPQTAGQQIKTAA
jgi:hypothetical protein